MTVQEITKQLRHTLAQAVDDGEARAMAQIIIEDIKGYTPVQRMMYGDRELLDATVDRMLAVVRRVVDGEPLQYALGQARWRGRRFEVTPDVLIPRPETAQLVDMIVDRNQGRSDLDVLDIGTGSGCIAISLAIDLDFARVEAIDISPAAAAVAKRNAKALGANVAVKVLDANRLGDDAEMSRRRYDIIVSNPPYVLESERATIDRRVLDHEPQTALFVPDARPIDIYREIARYGATALKPRGRLYLEINPLCAHLLTDMLKAEGYGDVSVERDYRGARRFIVASL